MPNESLQVNDESTEHGTPHLLSARDVAQLLANHGIQTIASVLAETPAGARDAAAQLRTAPLVLKAAGLNHKSDSGGVVMGLMTPASVQKAATSLLHNLGPVALPFLVQPQVNGLEILVGLRRVHHLGASLVVGLGGVQAELMGDSSHQMLPVDSAAARLLLERLRIWPLLNGYRGKTATDIKALCELMARVSELGETVHEIVELDLNPVFVFPEGEGVTIADARAVQSTVASPARVNIPRDIDRLLRPKTVAVVGVSDRPDAVGTTIFRRLLRCYAGQVFAIHPKGGDYEGHHRATDLSELPIAADLVCIAVGARDVPAIVDRAASLGCGGVLVCSAGFAETGQDGLVLQDELLDVTRRAGISVVGPNSIGIVSPRTGLLASFAGVLEAPTMSAGPVALVSGSGALGSCLVSRLSVAEVGISHWISTGNEVDLTMADFVSWLATDDETQAVGLILDNIVNGPGLIEAIRLLRSRGKPAFAYLLARSRSGREAARSHTGALVGSYELRRDLLISAGAVLTDDLLTLEDALALSVQTPLPAGRRLGVITASGGASTIIADEANDRGLELPALPEAIIADIKSVLPAFAVQSNPLDVTASIIADPTVFTEALRMFAESVAFDAVIIQLTTNADPTATATAKALVAASEAYSKPIYVARYGSPTLAPMAMEVFREARLRVLDTPERLMSAVSALVSAGESIATISATRGGESETAQRRNPANHSL